jgi:uncharacterized membrane protein
MVRKFFSIFLAFILFTFFCTSVKAQSSNPSDEFFRAKVEAITNQGETITDSQTLPFQEVKLQILDAPEKGKEIVIEYGKDVSLTQDQLVNVGQTVVIDKTVGPDGTPLYQITDKYRLDNVWPIVIFFFLIVLILSQWKGAGSILGLIISLGVILKYIVPQILAGHDPLTVSIIGCLIIMITTIYLAHGFSVKTTIAVFSTFLTLVGIGFMSALFVKITFLTGLGSEDAASLRFGTTANIDFRGLLLGGILIGALGVLDDVTTGLSASVFELHKANPKMTFPQLFAAGLSIGKEHISSLVNTLVLAYAGAALPIFLMIILNVNRYPLWSILNDGLIIEEAVRTLAGSIGLVAAVPLTTLLATLYVTRLNRKSLSHSR